MEEPRDAGQVGQGARACKTVAMGREGVIQYKGGDDPTCVPKGYAQAGH